VVTAKWRVGAISGGDRHRGRRHRLFQMHRWVCHTEAVTSLARGIAMRGRRQEMWCRRACGVWCQNLTGVERNGNELRGHRMPGWRQSNHAMPLAMSFGRWNSTGLSIARTFRPLPCLCGSASAMARRHRQRVALRAYRTRSGIHSAYVIHQSMTS
jgi:hypothetical protein